jgi:TolB protein
VLFFALMFCTLPKAVSAQEDKSKGKVPEANGGLPLVSPNGALVAFIANRNGNYDLFVMASDGSKVLSLTRTPEYESIASWTQDSKRVLFSVNTTDSSVLYSIDVEGNNQREVCRVNGRNPVPSPDGKRILFSAGPWTATKLMLADADGSNLSELTDGSTTAWNHRWSPDGKLIAFAGRSNSKSELAVFVMDLETRKQRQITLIPLDEGGAQWPMWSWDGRYLAVQVSSRTDRKSGYIWVVTVTSGEARKLGIHDQTFLDETPSWFPDGKRIAFQSNRTGRMEIWVMNVDGSNPRQVTR